MIVVVVTHRPRPSSSSSFVVDLRRRHRRRRPSTSSSSASIVVIIRHRRRRRRHDRRHHSPSSWSSLSVVVYIVSSVVVVVVIASFSTLGCSQVRKCNPLVVKWLSLNPLVSTSNSNTDHYSASNARNTRSASKTDVNLFLLSVNCLSTWQYSSSRTTSYNTCQHVAVPM